MIARLSKRMASFFARNNVIKSEDEEVYEYGLQLLLTNLEEFLSNTYPYIDDSDNDGLSDGDEVNKYETDPLVADTDGDGLDDGDEITLGTNPLVQDTDGDGIIDSKEKFQQTYTHKVKNEDCAVTEVIVDMECTGNINKTTSVESVMNTDILCTDVVGLIGEPFEIETTSEFDTATLTFTIDKSKLGETEFANLMFLWYNEEENDFVELETTLDEENSTVSITTTHFSKYMVIDKYKWFEAWAVEFDYNPTGGGPGAPTIPVKYNTVLAVDCSGSMDWNDPISIRSGINSAYDALHPYTCNRITAAEGFIKYMNSNDETAIVLFTDSANTASSMTTDKETLKLALQKMYSNGGTSFSAALNASIKQIESAEKISNGANKNRIILLSDGDDNDSASRRNAAIQMCNDKYIEVYTVGFGSANDTILQNIADKTGGKYYKALNAQDIVDIFAKLGYMDDFDMTDTDGDGLPDAVETAGIRLQNGKIIYGCDPTNPDSDNDGLLDGEEINPSPIYSEKEDNGWLGLKKLFGINKVQGYYFEMNSNPNSKDSDGDGLYDGQRVIYDIANSEPVFENEISNKSLITDKTKYRIMIPIDDDLMHDNDYEDAWKSQMEAMENGNICTEYSPDRGDPNEVMNSMAENAYSLVNILMEYDWIVNENFINFIEFMFKDSAQGDTAEELGADFLDFIFDEDGIAYHSQVETWQRAFGYNKLYDKVFEYGSNMLVNRIVFSYDNEEYILWSWKGDYWNLQSGGETGIYVYNRHVGKTDHYDVASFNMPMTLSLYKGSGSQMESIFNWAPTEDQWWVTGFNPDFTKPDPYDMTMICSVDFTNYEEMYKAFHRNYRSDKPIDVIFDEYYQTMWFVWQ